MHVYFPHMKYKTHVDWYFSNVWTPLLMEYINRRFNILVLNAFSGNLYFTRFTANVEIRALWYISAWVTDHIRIKSLIIKYKIDWFMNIHSSHQSEIQINAFICCSFDPERKQNNKRANHTTVWGCASSRTHPFLNRSELSIARSGSAPECTCEWNAQSFSDAIKK